MPINYGRLLRNRFTIKLFPRKRYAKRLLQIEDKLHTINNFMHEVLPFFLSASESNKMSHFLREKGNIVLVRYVIGDM